MAGPAPDRIRSLSRLAPLPYSPLENAVMAALAWDLEDVAPDLAGQFEESLPGARRNTGFGLTTEMIVSARRPAPPETPTGLFGTVHAMVADLPGSMAFKARLRDGVLLGLEGDAFDMETDQIDFATTPFHTVFTVDDQGQSVRFDPAKALGRSPLRDLQTWAAPTPEAVYTDPPLINIGALQRVQDAGRTATYPLAMPEPARPSDKPSAKLDEAQTSLFIGLCVAIAAIALLLWWLLRLPLVLVVFVAFWSCRVLRNPKALATISTAFANLQTLFDAWLKTAQRR